MSGTRCIHLHLLVDDLIVNGDIVEVDLVLVGQLDLELRSHGNVEYKSIGCFTLNIHSLLLVAGHGFAEHLDLVLVYILVDLLAQELVDHVHLHGGTILALDHAHGHHSLTETRHLSLLAVVFQCLLDILLIISLLYSQRHQSIHFVWILKCYFHLY